MADINSIDDKVTMIQLSNAKAYEKALMELKQTSPFSNLQDVKGSIEIGTMQNLKNEIERLSPEDKEDFLENLQHISFQVKLEFTPVKSTCIADSEDDDIDEEEDSNDYLY